MNDLRRHLIDVYEFEWNTALLRMALTSGAVVSMPALEPQEDILNIYHKLAKTLLTVRNEVKIYG